MDGNVRSLTRRPDRRSRLWPRPRVGDAAARVGNVRREASPLMIASASSRALEAAAPASIEAAAAARRRAHRRRHRRELSPLAAAVAPAIPPAARGGHGRLEPPRAPNPRVPPPIRVRHDPETRPLVRSKRPDVRRVARRRPRVRAPPVHVPLAPLPGVPSAVWEHGAPEAVS